MATSAASKYEINDDRFIVPFVEACKEDDVDQVRALVEDGFDPKGVVSIEMGPRECKSERYPFDVAIRAAALKVMRFMVREAGVDPNACIAPWGRFKPIQYAVSKAVTETLLELGATFPEGGGEVSSHPLFCAMTFRPKDEELAMFIATHEKCRDFVEKNRYKLMGLACDKGYLKLIIELGDDSADEDEEIIIVDPMMVS